MSSEIQSSNFDDLDDDIKLVNEKALTWFDVSCIGTGEMLITAGFAWIVFIASIYGLKWSLIGFVAGAVVIHLVWWLYREMITAVPESGSIQSYAREAGIFSIGTSYYVAYALVYAAFMWLELSVAEGLFHDLFPTVPSGVWPYLIVLPVMAINLLGTQITGKVQTIMVIVTLVGDGFGAILVWHFFADRHDFAANWGSPSPINWLSPFTVTGLWIGGMAGILEVQQLLVDEWSNFKRSRDVGLLSAAWQLWVRQIPLIAGVLCSMPIAALSVMAVPTVEMVHAKAGTGPIFFLVLGSMLVATYTTFCVFFMAGSRILALYAQQGALPRFIGKYSSRSVPWVSIIILAVLALFGVYYTNTGFLISMLSNWSASLYVLVPVCFLGMRFRKSLDRPLKVAFGIPIAILLIVLVSVIAYSIFISNWQAGAAWYVAVILFALYDAFIVPRTKRGKHYRAQVLRNRTSAARL